ncbi:tetratricopeptide repeat protein, partial [Aeromicrobium sp.]|uniref:tetratricopeptide repeat protein n=1 Tax=Aeromicrobium sp. TaxID=1871063 RepID=UPI003C66A2A0
YALAQTHLLFALGETANADLGTQAQITADLSLANQALGKRERAMSLAQSAVALAEQAREPRVLGQAYNLLGMVGAGDDTDEAMINLGRARQIAEDLDDTDLIIAVLNNLALAHRRRGALDQALELTTRALELCGRLGDRHHEAALHNNLADLLQASGRGEEAMVHLKAAARIFTDIGVEEQPHPEIWKLVRW